MSLLVHALIRLLPAAGGFRTSGWRATCEFDGVMAPDGATRFGCEVVIPDDRRLDPGQEADATLRLWVPTEMQPDLKVGKRLRIMEGHKEVATGEVETVSTV
jgi:hypothetical protein